VGSLAAAAAIRFAYTSTAFRPARSPRTPWQTTAVRHAREGTLAAGAVVGGAALLVDVFGIDATVREGLDGPEIVPRRPP
jgi:hypothetical protein